MLTAVEEPNLTCSNNEKLAESLKSRIYALTDLNSSRYPSELALRRAKSDDREDGDYERRQCHGPMSGMPLDLRAA